MSEIKIKYCAKCKEELTISQNHGNWWKLQERFCNDYLCTDCHFNFSNIIDKIRQNFYTGSRKPIWKLFFGCPHFAYEHLKVVPGEFPPSYFRMFNRQCIRAYREFIRT